jgi:hypothetical protein
MNLNKDKKIIHGAKFTHFVGFPYIFFLFIPLGKINLPFQALQSTDLQKNNLTEAFIFDLQKLIPAP